MSPTAIAASVEVRPKDRLEVLFEELAELAGQRNAIDGRIVQIVAEIDRDGIWGATGARSVAALVGWKLASVATVSQLRTAVKLEPRPKPDPDPRREPQA